MATYSGGEASGGMAGTGGEGLAAWLHVAGVGGAGTGGVWYWWPAGAGGEAGVGGMAGTGGEAGVGGGGLRASRCWRRPAPAEKRV